MLTTKIYYYLKPLIPRGLQIILRRQMISRQRLSCKDTWPIDQKAAKPHHGWSGWPEQKQFAVVLQHHVETKNGHDKCHELMEVEENLGFRSSFNFVPERYEVSEKLRNDLTRRGFEVAVHGLKHDGRLFSSKNIFQRRATRINRYLKEWRSVGFSSPSMHRNLDWIHALNIEYDTSTFDTDPFEPQPDGIGTIFPVSMDGKSNQKGFIELPYTIPQDFTLFVLMKEKNIDIWKRKIDWIIEKGGMALLLTHPDYMNFGGQKLGIQEYPAEFYMEFLEHVKSKYEGQYWHVLPKDVARLCQKNMLK